MEKRRAIVWLTLVVGAAALGPTGAHAQVDQSTLAAQIRGVNANQRSRALEQARLLGPEGTGPELRAALITALEQEGQLHAQHYHADRRGEQPQPLADPEFLLQLSRVVAELRDPEAIPALTGALGTGAPVLRSLVAFGEEAVPGLLRAVRSPETIHYVVDDALIALRLMAEGAGPHPLSAGALTEVRRVAKLRLSGKQYFTTLWDAIDLAMALDDPELTQVVRLLAADRDAVIARGIEDPELIQETQRLAAERLAGVPAWRP